MTVASTTRKTVPVIGNGVTVAFPFGFKVFAKADISFITTVIATGVSTTLVLDSDYSVVLNADQDNNPGGTVTYPLSGAILPATKEAQIISNVIATQALNLPAGGGNYNAQVIEDSLDKALIVAQQLIELGARSLSFPPIDSNSGQIPSAVTRALQTLAFDAAGNPVAGSPSSAIVATPMQPVVAAASLALARIALGINEQVLWCGTAGGTANALTLTPTNAVEALVAGLTLRFKSGAAVNTAATTLSPSGLTVTAMQSSGAAMVGGELQPNQWYEAVYDGAAFQVTQLAPGVALAQYTTKGDMQAATAAGAVSRLPAAATGLALVSDSALAQGVGYEVRNLERSQCPLNGSVDTNGLANFLTTGAGLRPGLTATAQALLLAFGTGYDAGGNIDTTALLSADVADILGVNLPVSNRSYIFADRSSASAVVWGSTLAPPQARETYDQTKQSVLQFAGAPGATVFLDDFGNTWAAQGGARVQTNQFKFGTGGLGGSGAANALNGTTDFVKTTNTLSLGSGGWAIRAWAYCTVLPGSGLTADIMGVTNAGGFGARINIYNNTGTIKFGYSASADGTTVFINNVQGTTTPLINTWYFVELTFDALAGVYRLYVNGTQESSTASALKVTGSSVFGLVGAAASSFTGYVDKPEIVPYCQHPAGTAYANPTAAPDVTAVGYASEFYNIVQRKLFGISAASSAAAANPTFTAKTRVYAGECDTSGAAVTAARSYAYKGRYLTLPSAYIAGAAGAAGLSFTHNIGFVPRIFSAFWVNHIMDQGYVPGDIIVISASDNASNTQNGMANRLSIFYLQSAQIAASNVNTAARSGLLGVNWKVGGSADRGW